MIQNTKGNDNVNENGWYNYNILSNKWTPFVKCSIEIESYIPYPTIYNKKSDSIFIMDCSELVVYKCKTQGFKRIQHNINIGDGFYKRKVGAPTMIEINNEIHLIACADNDSFYHFKWDTAKQQFDEIHEFKDWYAPFDGAIVYLKSKKQLLLLTGTMCSKLYIYSMEHNHWTRVNTFRCPFFTTKCAYVLTYDEKYIIIFGGYMPEEEEYFDSSMSEAGTPNGSYTSDWIYVMDTDTYETHKSEIQCPGYNCNYQAVLMTNIIYTEIMICGYVRMKLKIDPYLMLFSDILQLIVKWYCLEYIYLLGDERNCHSDDYGNWIQHWRINIDHILSNMGNDKESVQWVDLQAPPKGAHSNINVIDSFNFIILSEQHILDSSDSEIDEEANDSETNDEDLYQEDSF
eukprot:401739_1